MTTRPIIDNLPLANHLEKLHEQYNMILREKIHITNTINENTINALPRLVFGREYIVVSKRSGMGVTGMDAFDFFDAHRLVENNPEIIRIQMRYLQFYSRHSLLIFDVTVNDVPVRISVDCHSATIYPESVKLITDKALNDVSDKTNTNIEGHVREMLSDVASEQTIPPLTSNTVGGRPRNRQRRTRKNRVNG